MKQSNYTGKTIYIGIDVHKKTYSCVSICEDQIVKRDTIPAIPEILLNYLKNSFQRVVINTAYEAGFSGFYLHRFLMSHEIHNIVVNPSSIETAAKDRVKTDKRDALKLATQLAANRLQGIHVPDQAREEKRSVTRLRTAILKMRHQAGQQLKSLLFTQGLIDMADDAVISKKWVEKKLMEVKNAGYSEDFIYSVSQYADQWIHLTNNIKEIELKLKMQSNQDKVLQLIYESVPGIGAIHGRQLANELGDMKHFKNEKQIFSYTGLTPSEYSSGENIRQGHITRQGNSILRKILVEAAWVAIKKDPSLDKSFKRIAARRGKKIAIVGVARRLIGRIRSCVLTGSMYEVKSIEEACSLQGSMARPRGSGCESIN